MKSKHSTPRTLEAGFKPGIRSLMILLVLAIALAALAQAQPASAPPPTPTACTPSSLLQGATNVTLTVTGTTSVGGIYDFKKGNIFLTAAFSGTGVTINSITVTNTTTLSLNVSVAANATPGGRTLTVTNPDGKTATSSAPLLQINDVPVILAASVTPNTPNTASTLAASVTNLSSLDGLPVTYTYDWQENGVSTGYSSSTLPPQATTVGNSYRCVITPIKGSIIGNPFTTAAVTIPKDADDNGMQDEWELANFGNVGTNPNDDDDGDGVKNRAEYLFGTNPKDHKSRSPIVAHLNPKTGKFTYSRALNKIDGVVYKVWTSPDLLTWTEQTPLTETPSVNGGSENVEIALNSALIAANKKLFVRVSAQ